MTARIPLLFITALLLLAGACDRPGARKADAGYANDAARPGSAVTTLDRAIAVAHAIRANPAATDSILAAHRLTRAGLDSLMYEVASDSAMARAYGEAVR